MRKIFNYVISDFVNLFLPTKYRSSTIIDFITSLINIQEFRNLYSNIRYTSTFTTNSDTILTLPFVAAEIEPLDIVIINGNINTTVTNIITTNNTNNTITVNNNINSSGNIIIIKNNFYIKSKINAKISGQKRILETYLRSFFNEPLIKILINSGGEFSKFFYKQSENNTIIYFSKHSENNPIYLYKKREFNDSFDFLVEAPTAFENTNKELILIDLIERYKTYNTRFKINYV